jgi:hypothetical protein
MSMGPQAKRQRFLEHCSEGAADSHVDNSCFSLPEVNEVNEVQVRRSPLPLTLTLPEALSDACRLFPRRARWPLQTA